MFMPKQMALKDKHTFTLFHCLYVADPATFPASNSVQFPLRTAGLFTCGKINI